MKKKERQLREWKINTDKLKPQQEDTPETAETEEPKVPKSNDLVGLNRLLVYIAMMLSVRTIVMFFWTIYKGGPFTLEEYNEMVKIEEPGNKIYTEDHEIQVTNAQGSAIQTIYIEHCGKIELMVYLGELVQALTDLLPHV